MDQTSAPNCDFCSKTRSKYTCPRCHRRYCSSACYASKDHDSCAQLFYRKCVVEELQSHSADPGTRKNMIDILQRMAKSGGEADFMTGEEDDIVSRFEGIDFSDNSADGTAKLLSRLTPDERKDFENMICSGSIVRLIPDEEKSDPWWIKFTPVLVVDESDSESPGFGHKRELVNRLPHLSSLTKTEPSPSLKFCLMNLIVAYCCTYRLFDGDVKSCSDEFVEELRTRSIVVRDAHVFHDTATALHHCTQNLISDQHIPVSLVRQLFQDVKMIISNRNAVLELLSDTWFVVHDCLTSASSNNNNKAEKLLLKKLEFLISWTKDRGHELEPLVQEVDVLVARVGVGNEDGV